MLFNSMTDNYKNNQSVIDYKSNFKTSVNKSTTLSDQKSTTLSDKKSITLSNQKSNTRKPWRIFCYDCNSYTESIEPIIIRRHNTHSFAFLTACEKCDNVKTLALSDYNCEKFPSDYFKLPLHKAFKNNIITYKGEKRNILKDLFYIINEPLDEHVR